MTMGNIQSGFETTGVHPFNRSKLMPPEESMETSFDGLPFLPMLTPSRLSPRRMSDSRNCMYMKPGRPLQDILTYLHTLPAVKPRQSSRITTAPEEIKKMEVKVVQKAQENFRKEQNRYIKEMKKGE